MRSILKATAMLGSVSLVNMVTGLVSAKVSALLLGPIGLGQLALLQAMLTVAGLVAAMGMSAALVRSGAHALQMGNDVDFAVLRRGAAGVLVVSGTVAAVGMIVLREPLAAWALGSASRANGVIVMAAATVLTLAAGYQTSILNAHHRVRDLARVGLATAIFGPTASIAIIVTFREDGVAWAVLAPTVVGVVAAWMVRRRALPVTPSTKATLSKQVATARQLLGFGAPFTVSMMLSAGVLYLMPVLVLNRLSETDVGYYRAASTLAVTYIGFLMTTLQQDYNPRVSAVQHDAKRLCALINEQLHVVLLIGAPLIFGMIALAPLIVRIVFSSRFMPAVGLLEWQLIGDIFKLASWTMAFVILARMGSRAFLMTEGFAGVMLLGSSWLATEKWGLQGVGIAYTASYAAYCSLCWALLRWRIGLQWSRSNFAVMAAIVSGLIMVVVSGTVIPWADRSLVAAVLTAIASICSGYVLDREFGIVAYLRERLWPLDRRTRSERQQ